MSRPTIEPGIGIWAEKLNMTTIFEEEEGNVRTVPATILCVKRGGNMITDKKWPEKHGHYAVQVGYERYTPDESLESKGLYKLWVTDPLQLMPTVSHMAQCINAGSDKLRVHTGSFQLKSMSWQGRRRTARRRCRFSVWHEMSAHP